MNAQVFIINTLLPTAISLMALWIVYRLLFSNINRVQFNRFFLLSATVFAFALPLLGLIAGNESPQMVSLKQNLFGGIMLNEVTVASDGAAITEETGIVGESVSERHLDPWRIVGSIYLIGLAISALLFLIKLGKLAQIIMRSPKEKRDGYTAVFTGRDEGSFSFMHYAFFPNENVSPDIVRHELSHMRHHHSWDILLVETTMILQWFNPFIYLYKKELQSLHEYTADRDVVATGIDKRNYMMLILQQCTAVDFSGISNNFSLILTKKRIKMITKNEKAKSLWWRLLATVPVLAILLIANTRVTAQEQGDNEMLKFEFGQFEIRDDDGNPMQLKDTVIYNEDGTFLKFEVDGKKAKITACNADGTPVKDINITKEEGGLYSAEPIYISKKAVKNYFNSTKQSDDTIHNVVEVMPEFPGGTGGLMRYISKNIKYPETAMNKGIQGRVFVKFVVEKDGSVSDVNILHGIGGGCDEEAVRVVSSMPKWTPGKMNGKNVRVYYNLPINFKLTDYKPVEQGILESTSWKGTGTGTKDGVTYVMDMTMEIESKESGYFVMTLTSQKKRGKTVVEYENVGLPFTYTFDGKTIGAINPVNPDGTYMTEETVPPYGFSISPDGKMIVNFYDFKNDIGVEYITFEKVK